MIDGTLIVVVLVALAAAALLTIVSERGSTARGVAALLFGVAAGVMAARFITSALP